MSGFHHIQYFVSNLWHSLELCWTIFPFAAFVYHSANVSSDISACKMHLTLPEDEMVAALLQVTYSGVLDQRVRFNTGWGPTQVLTLTSWMLKNGIWFQLDYMFPLLMDYNTFNSSYKDVETKVSLYPQFPDITSKPEQGANAIRQVSNSLFVVCLALFIY